jgi:hypothetical protein
MSLRVSAKIRTAKVSHPPLPKRTLRIRILRWQENRWSPVGKKRVFNPRRMSPRDYHLDKTVFEDLLRGSGVRMEPGSFPETFFLSFHDKHIKLQASPGAADKRLPRIHLVHFEENMSTVIACGEHFQIECSARCHLGA